MKYEKEIAFLIKVEDVANPQNIRRKLDNNTILELMNKYPTIPEEYLDYLKEIGVGSFRENQFVVQGHLFDLADLGLQEHYELKQGIKFFGDNFSGDFSGFDLSKDDGLVVEFWHEDGTFYETGKKFKEYIRTQMLMNEKGVDT